MSGRDSLIACLHRDLDLLPWVPDSMSRTLHSSCLKTIRRLAAQGWISDVEAVQLSTRVRNITRNRDPSRCGFDHKER